jgi:metal-responsive CopG/Arc/MetJ family transcriptional regulator
MKTDDDARRMAVYVPSRLANAIDAAARRDYMSASDIVRLAVAEKLRERGFLNEPATA